MRADTRAVSRLRRIRRCGKNPRMLLHRLDPGRHMHRFYRLRLDSDLFGRATVLREWGSIGSPGKVRIDIHADRAAAEAWHARLVAAKLRKGYAPPC